ncbi:MAG: hypothetical protein IT372_15880 [Polyangiaceae bacterium]|nr:hypothetical protein [Polyangiaceae bacterium]
MMPAMNAARTLAPASRSYITARALGAAQSRPSTHASASRSARGPTMALQAMLKENTPPQEAPEQKNSNKLVAKSINHDRVLQQAALPADASLEARFCHINHASGCVIATLNTGGTYTTETKVYKSGDSLLDNYYKNSVYFKDAIRDQKRLKACHHAEVKVLANLDWKLLNLRNTPVSAHLYLRSHLGPCPSCKQAIGTFRYRWRASATIEYNYRDTTHHYGWKEDVQDKNGWYKHSLGEVPESAGCVPENLAQ